MFSLKACKFGCLICTKGYIWSATPDFKIHFQVSLICIIILLKADSLFKRRNFFHISYFPFSDSLYLGFLYCGLYLCDGYKCRVSLRIPNLCVCVWVYCWTRWRVQSYPICCWKIFLFSLWYDRKYQRLIKKKKKNQKPKNDTKEFTKQREAQHRERKQTHGCQEKG